MYFKTKTDVYFLIVTLIPAFTFWDDREVSSMYLIPFEVSKLTESDALTLVALITLVASLFSTHQGM